jgi:hypothetical protein
VNWPQLRERAPWIARDVLWGGQGVVLTTVSAYYSLRWALAHGFPTVIAGSLFVALELSALLGLVVMSHPVDRRAHGHAVALVIGSAVLAALVNGLQHAMDRGLVGVTTPGVLLTGSVVPVMLAWSSHVARGMSARPWREQVSVSQPVMLDSSPISTETILSESISVGPKIPLIPPRFDPEPTLTEEAKTSNEEMSPVEYLLNAWRFGRRVEAQELYSAFPTRRRESLRSVMSTTRKKNPELEPPVRTDEEDRNGRNRKRGQAG